MTCLLRALRRLLPLLLLVVILPADAARLALVIGNADYLEGPLRNPVRDARAVAARLGTLGFAVTKVENLKRDDIGRTVETFAGAIRPGDDVVVYYAGHGVQVKGTNYLPAVDARIQRESDVPMHSLNLGDLLDLLDQAKAGVKVVLLDACRNNPYARSFRDDSRGLARISNAPSGTLIHYATRPGQVAADGDGSNGLYTTQLLKAMDTPGLVVELLFKQVASEVKRASKGEQEPWMEGHLDGSFMFNPGSGRAKASALPGIPAAPGAANADFDDLEQAQRQVVEVQRKWEAWQRAMQAAFDKAAKLTATPEIEAKAWERFLATYGQDNPNSTEDERLRAEAGRRLAAAQAKRASAAAVAVPIGKPGAVFRDCPECPEMVVIPSGEFDMGSQAGEGESAERPLHRVRITRFALGKYEVTQGQWRAVMGYSPSTFENCGDDCPVEMVSWADAKGYVRKLNTKLSGGIDGPYRLPSETEWEYACRSGARHRYCGSDSIDRVAWHGKNSNGKSHSVGTKAANGFGLHDMTGNVMEWLEDCWHDNYGNAPTGAEAWMIEAVCHKYLVRGGSWHDEPTSMRAAKRGWVWWPTRDFRQGFRVAKTLP
jgi:formylglycine-generating enzyme required for sulfatase activity